MTSVITVSIAGVYPRACGGTPYSGPRGNSVILRQVYPRACGGTFWTSLG